MASHITQPHDFLLNRLFKRKSKKTSKLRITGLCEGNSPVTGEFPAQRTSNTEHVSIDDVIMAGVVMVDSNLNNEIPAMVKLPGQYGVISAILWSYGII